MHLNNKDTLTMKERHTAILTFLNHPIRAVLLTRA